MLASIEDLNMPQIQLAPSDIYYSQSSISHCFTNAEKSIGDTVDDILFGRCRIGEIPKISVVRKKDMWVTADNRRLWVFRVLESLGHCDTITVKVKKYLDRGKNVIKRDVKVRGDPGGFFYELKKTLQCDTEDVISAIASIQLGGN